MSVPPAQSLGRKGIDHLDARLYEIPIGAGCHHQVVLECGRGNQAVFEGKAATNRPWYCTTTDVAKTARHLRRSRNSDFAG